MNPDSPCPERRDDMVALVLGLLEASSADPLRRHLDVCPSCRRFFESLSHREIRLNADFQAAADHLQTLTPPLSETLIRAADPEPKPTLSTGSRYRLFHYPRLIRFAAVFIVVAGLLGLFFLLNSSSSPSQAFADLVRPLLDAHTVTYRITIQVPDQSPETFDGMFLAPGHLRHSLDDRIIQIFDLKQKKALMINHLEKKATLLAFDHLSGRPNGHHINRFLEIKNTLRQAHYQGPSAIEFLGKYTFNDRALLGYRLRRHPPEMTVWADPQTHSPARLEYILTSPSGKILTVIMTDIAYDIPLDPFLFDLDVPAGYSLEQLNPPLPSAGNPPGTRSPQLNEIPNDPDPLHGINP